MSKELADAFFTVVDESIGWILECTEGLDTARLNWRPVEDGNSLHAIANHTMANAERNILSSYLGKPYAYDRAAEFAAEAKDGDTPLGRRWAELRARIVAGMAAAGPEAFDRDCDHVRMVRVKGWEVLVQVSRHAAEHVGEARLTRQLIEAASSQRRAPEVP
ncbi:MAG: hypothetical protein C0506_00010 [Anaerolinea sp.]|nr:hypothetical protein [Anaerolinea sp.]